MFNPDIYRSYDIRGIVPGEFGFDEAYHIGRAYAVYMGVKRVVVARDMRPSGDEIEPELIRGLTDGGINVIQIGLATSPLFYFAVHKLKAEGGLMVTASHNPGEYNGIKMTREKAIPVGGGTGLSDIRDLVEKRQWSEVKRAGKIEEANVREDYLDMVCKGADASGLKIVVDAGNGMAGMLLADVFKRIGGEAVPLYWDLDGNFPNHEADPLKEENMQDLQSKVGEEKADLGVAFDGDGDRVFFCTEKGITVSGDITTALIAQKVLKGNSGATILYDLRSSRVTREIIERAGGRAVMSKVGHSNIKAQMRKEGAVFAGELSGHLYFTPWYAESGLLAMNYVIRVLRERQKPFSAVVAPLFKYAKSPEVNFEVNDKEAAMKRIKSKYSDAEILTLDGITVNYSDWWANVRPSNTEPLLRLNMEADTEELLKEKQREIEKLITN
ncbi:MAG: phosphomannomutase/phosphoglucomutase [bacterium]